MQRQCNPNAEKHDYMLRCSLLSQTHCQMRLQRYILLYKETNFCYNIIVFYEIRASVAAVCRE